MYAWYLLHIPSQQTEVGLQPYDQFGFFCINHLPVFLPSLKHFIYGSSNRGMFYLIIWMLFYKFLLNELGKFENQILHAAIKFWEFFSF